MDQGVEVENVSPARAWYVVVICMIAYVFSFVDRQILSLLIAPIKSDLGISDTAFAFLHGFAFSIFYAALGIPVAGLSDRLSRPKVIAGGIAIWSLATAACGLAGSFGALFSARVMVGAGEAALSPASYALINDMFPRERLGRAIGLYSLGSFVGAGLAFVAGGAVIALVSGHGPIDLGPLALKPWQFCFVLVGLPGLALALLVRLTVREPRKVFGSRGEASGVVAVFALVWRERAIFGPHLIGYAFSGWGLFASLAWAPAVMARTFGFAPAQAGLWLGPVAMAAGGGGAFASGWLMDRLARAGRGDASLVAGIVGGIGTAAFSLVLALVAPLGAGPGLAALGGLLFFASFPLAPSSSMIQIVAPPAMRARVAALMICGTALVGSGLGTLLIGLLNDHWFGGGAGVVWSMSLITGAGGVLSALILAPGCAPLRRFVAARG